MAAEAKPGWQSTWEKTIEAAKKEGRLNFYVGRYGSEPLLNEFRKEFPWLKLVTVNGSGNSLGTRIIAEIRAGHMVADLFSGGEDIKQVLKMLKSREVYRHLSNASDRGDEAANVIADIVVKMT